MYLVWIYIFKSKIIINLKILKVLCSRGYEDGIREENISLFNNPGDVLILLLDFGIIRIHCITMLYNFDI